MTSPGAVALLAVAVFVDGLLEPQPATARIKASAASAPAIARKPGRTGRLRISLWPRVGTGRTVSQRDPVQIKGRAKRAARVSEGTRTPDRLDHNQELYQLSYAHHASGPKSSDGSMLWTRLALQLAFGQREALARGEAVRARRHGSPPGEQALRLGAEHPGRLGSRGGLVPVKADGAAGGGPRGVPPPPPGVRPRPPPPPPRPPPP